MRRPMRRTLPTVAVATELLAAPDRARWAYELAEKLGIWRGSINTILKRMKNEGWLSDFWEDDPSTTGPRRHYYRVEPTGRQELANLIESNPGSEAEKSDYNYPAVAAAAS